MSLSPPHQLSSSSLLHKTLTMNPWTWPRRCHYNARPRIHQSILQPLMSSSALTRRRSSSTRWSNPTHTSSVPPLSCAGCRTHLVVDGIPPTSLNPLDLIPALAASALFPSSSPSDHSRNKCIGESCAEENAPAPGPEVGGPLEVGRSSDALSELLRPNSRRWRPGRESGCGRCRCSGWSWFRHGTSRYKCWSEGERTQPNDLRSALSRFVSLCTVHRYNRLDVMNTV